MMMIITYDVNTETAAGRKRLRKVAKQCQNYGQRVQNSVFECIIDPALFKILRNELIQIMDAEKDSIRFYNLGNKWKNRIEHVGTKHTMNLEDSLIV
ncbi:CRISPR-associated endonuclease Cas2 [Flexilinea flocculi]|uniref:CRISPR-associated endoribonuclease Cas2 n=1 Tax=Flexilinea flocculi TaxID=1678840 RepID=A0A0K8P9W0_9CHLR|nr:CRISPR-associated endonuclease Cas2 [Flexilinea flocculi]GAP39426.1 CRISPR-associated protein, Cas2 family [Flexilinea flocculi]